MTKKIFEFILTGLITIITLFIKQMAVSLRKIEKDLNTLNTDHLLFMQETKMRLDSAESRIESLERPM